MDHPDRVIILGGGWSVADQKVDREGLKKFGYVIGVNDSGIKAPVDLIVSMDRLWMKNRYPEMLALSIPTMVRQSAWRVNMKDAKTWPGFSTFENSYKTGVLSSKPGTLNGCNSGFCALNMAYQLKPKQIFLFGFDHRPHPNKKSAYWYPPYPWSPDSGNKRKKYMDWSRMYQPAAEQLHKAMIAVYNVSPQSQLSNFFKIPYSEFLDRCAK